MSEKKAGSRKPDVVQVFVFRDGRFFGTDCFAESRIVIGLGAQADLKLDDEEVSRAHACVVLDEEGLIVEDLQSANGTCVNGEPVSRVRIDQWDEVCLGAFTLKFKVLTRSPQVQADREETRVLDLEPTPAEPTVDEVTEVPPEDEETTPDEVEISQSEADAGLVCHDFRDMDEEDEEQATENFVEPFSLLSNLVRESFANPSVPTEPRPVMEVIRYSSERSVLRYDQVSRGERYWPASRGTWYLRYREPDTCQLMFSDDVSGGVMSQSRTVALDELKDDAHRVARKKGVTYYATRLAKGDYANLVHEGGADRSCASCIRPSSLPPPRTRKLDITRLKIYGSACAFHLLLVVLLGVFTTRVNAASDRDIDQFAFVSIDKIPMDKPDLEPEIPLDIPDVKPETPQEVEPQPEPDEPETKPAKVRKTARKKGVRGDGRPKGKGGEGGGAGMMAALGQMKNMRKTGIQVDVTNIHAEHSPGGHSRYKISDIVTKLPTSKVVTSRGRGVGLRHGIEFLRSGKGRGGRTGIGPGALTGGSTGTRNVGGVVFDQPPPRKIKKKGHLSKEQIARVVKQHRHEIQHCYEKNLLRDNKLRGNLRMEWTINAMGKVSLVRTLFNSMHTPVVARCVSARIKRWTFPRPKRGGIVVVEYPFLFEQVGFNP